ncbi:terminase family protein [Candidatus Dojkabacteria bacterium]|jgi:hypothetical protein|nr:terminase family protein [Candidatus Dojkabacteria bacterium]
MLLHQAQKEIAIDKHRFRVLCCGRRFGKTTLAVEEIKGKALYRPEARIAYIATTYQQARDIAWQMLKKELNPIIKNINESRLELEVMDKNGGSSFIFLRGWESVDTLRGQYFDFLVLDEVASMRNFWLNWQEVLRPTLIDKAGEAMFISTPKGYNHFFELYNFEKENVDFKSFQYPSSANPYIKPTELEIARSQMTEDRFAQEHLADFRKTEGLVYKEFDRKRHLYDNKTIKPEIAEVLVGIDWGYTNPACVLKILKDRDNHYWVESEWYKTQQTTDQIIEQAKSCKPDRVYPDPAEPDRLELARRAGLNIREVSKDIAAGINAVRELFKQNRIMIHKDCVNTLWELETYRYPDKKPDKNEEEKPIKENDHAVDPLRYVLYMDEPTATDLNQNFNLYKTEYI